MDLYFRFRLNSIILIAIISMTAPLYGQVLLSRAQFDSVYDAALKSVSSDIQVTRRYLETLKRAGEPLTNLQLARIGYLQMKTFEADGSGMENSKAGPFKAPDSLRSADSLPFYARRYLERSMPDMAIPLLMKALKILPEHSPDADHARIELSEAYRQKMEYRKGIRMIMDLLEKKTPISDWNRAYAYNRLAALYNESGNPAGSYSDSVFNYSILCIDLAEKTGDKPDLAASQNELSFQYKHQGQYGRALELSKQAVSNFLTSGMTYQAMNALINQSDIFQKTNDFKSAFSALERATQLAPVWENRNLYMRIYLQYASLYTTISEYRDAYGFLNLYLHLQKEFFKDRMNSQIVEQSARFDLYVKEQQIRDEQRKNEYTHRQILLLIIIIIAIVLAFLFSIFYFRLRRKDVLKQKLIEAVVETENNERRRIARDLHDGLGPVLSAINHYFQAYLDAKPDKKEAIQERLQHVITEAIDEVSRISHNISPHVLEKHGLITALNNLFAPLTVNGLYQVRFDPGSVHRLDPKIELTLYRCITELLNNTLKHAQASQITLGFEQTNESLYIRYTDNGKGFKAENHRREGMGLSNIANRIESFGGSLSIDSSPNNGITVQITMPV